MPLKDFDPLEYIENAFLDVRKASVHVETSVSPHALVETPTLSEGEPKKGRFRKTLMSAPRPRRTRLQPSAETKVDDDLQAIWKSLPKNVEFLSGFFDDTVTSNYYRGEFKESRQELIRRLLDPELTLEETSRLLGVCPATVRRYTNRGWLVHHRTAGGQRRFHLTEVVKFVDMHGRFPEE